MHGLPALIPYVALSGYRRPGLPEGCPGYSVAGWHGRTRTSDRAVNSRLLYRLSYMPMWCRHEDSNPGPFAYKATALPLELWRRISGNKKPGTVAGFLLSLLDTRRNDRMGLISLIRSLMSTGNHAACSISKPSASRISAACARASSTKTSAALPISFRHRRRVDSGVPSLSQVFMS